VLVITKKYRLEIAVAKRIFPIFVTLLQIIYIIDIQLIIICCEGYAGG